MVTVTEANKQRLLDLAASLQVEITALGSVSGPDLDFGSPPMLARTPAGRDILVIGQKSGIGWALDPDKSGEVVWEYRAGRGGVLGGIGLLVAAQHLAFFDGDQRVILRPPVHQQEQREAREPGGPAD